MNRRADPPSDVPDEVFDADRVWCFEEDRIDRADWLVVDGQVRHDPVTWTWRCPECGETGELRPADLLGAPHGAQHAESAFAAVVPLDVSAVRRSGREL